MSEHSDYEKTTIPLDPEAIYLAEAELFRAGALELLNRFEAVRPDGFGWAIFGRSSDDPNIDHEEILIYAINQIPKGGLLPVQTIRIISNELYVDENDVQPSRWLARDFILDCDNDAQQVIDFMTPTLHYEDELPFATLFWIDGDGLLKTSKAFRSFPPSIDISDKDSPAPVFPLGSHEFLEDRIGALVLGKELFGLIEAREPIYTATEPLGYGES